MVMCVLGIGIVLLKKKTISIASPTKVDHRSSLYEAEAESPFIYTFRNFRFCFWNWKWRCCLYLKDQQIWKLSWWPSLEATWSLSNTGEQCQDIKQTVQIWNSLNVTNISIQPIAPRESACTIQPHIKYYLCRVDVWSETFTYGFYGSERCEGAKGLTSYTKKQYLYDHCSVFILGFCCVVKEWLW